jgi:hypothetical protein
MDWQGVMSCPKAGKEFVSLKTPEAWDDDPDCNKGTMPCATG